MDQRQNGNGTVEVESIWAFQAVELAFFVAYFHFIVHYSAGLAADESCRVPFDFEIAVVEGGADVVRFVWESYFWGVQG